MIVNDERIWDRQGTLRVGYIKKDKAIVIRDGTQHTVIFEENIDTFFGMVAKLKAELKGSNG